MHRKSQFHPEIIQTRRYAKDYDTGEYYSGVHEGPQQWREIDSDMPGVNLTTYEYGGIPMPDGTDYANWTRMHEMAHIKWSPTNLNKRYESDEIHDISLDSLNAAEDARINLLARTFLPNGKKYASRCDVTVPEIWKRLASLPNQKLLLQHLAASMGTKSEKTAMKALKNTKYAEAAQDFMDAAKKIMGYTALGNVSKRSVRDFSGHERIELAVLIESLGDRTQAPKRMHKPSIERNWGPRPNDLRPMPTIVHPPLVADTQRAHRIKRATYNGGRLNRPDKVANGSAAPFKRLLSTVGDPILVIDVSGSMAFTTDHLDRVMRTCPFATVMTYCGNSSASHITILAHNGKRVETVDEPKFGGNEIDDLAVIYALQCASETRAHVVWYSDGGVCSNHVDSEVLEQSMLDIFANTTNLSWCISFNAARKALENKGIQSYAPKKEFPPNSGYMAGHNIEKGIRFGSEIPRWRSKHDQ